LHDGVKKTLIKHINQKKIKIIRDFIKF